MFPFPTWGRAGSGRLGEFTILTRKPEKATGVFAFKDVLFTHSHGLSCIEAAFFRLKTEVTEICDRGKNPFDLSWRGISSVGRKNCRLNKVKVEVVGVDAPCYAGWFS
jgi:hypothetical protein